MGILLWSDNELAYLIFCRNLFLYKANVVYKVKYKIGKKST